MATNKEINVKVNSNFKETKDELDDLNEGLNETAVASEDVNASTSEMSANIGSLNPVVAAAINAFSGLRSGLKTVGKGFTTLRGAIIASGIGALVLAIISVTQAFKGSEEGQNKFSKLMFGIGVIMDNILDVLADVGELLISAFENPLESLKNFGKAIVNNILTRFEGILELIPALGSAISEVFSGNFSKAGKIAVNALTKVTFGVENVTDKLFGATKAFEKFFKEQSKEFKEAQKIADQRAQADKLERKLLVSRAKLQTEISKLRLKSREEDTVSAEERKKALIDAQALEDSLLKKELEVAQLRFDSIKKENTLARSTKEAKDAEAQAEADLFNIISRRTDQQRATQRELNRVNKEIEAQTKARQKVEKAALEFGVEFTEQMTNEEIVILTEAAKAKYDLLVKEGQERIKLQDSQDKLRIDLMDDGFDKELAKLVAESEARLAIAKDDKELQLEIEADFQKKLKELEEKTSKEIKDQKIKDAKTTADAEKKIQDAQISNVEAGISLVKSLAGENKKVQAAALIAENAVGIAKTIINTQTANAAALATPQAILTSGAAAAPVIAANNIAAGISIAASVAATAQGLSALGTGGSPEGGGDLPPGSGGGAQAPSFNVVGDSGVNQLAELQQQPTQAYVVSGEVTTAQALDRNRVQNATL